MRVYPVADLTYAESHREQLDFGPTAIAAGMPDHLLQVVAGGYFQDKACNMPRAQASHAMHVLFIAYLYEWATAYTKL